MIHAAALTRRSLLGLPTLVSGLAVVVLFGFPGRASADPIQFPVSENYYYDSDSGGIVDVDTGLVWSFPLWTAASYDWAVSSAPNWYEANSVLSYGFTDWRVPTKAELLDGAAKGLYDAQFDSAPIVNEALDLTGPDEIQVYSRDFRAVDPKFTVKGKWMSYAVDIGQGTVGTFTIGSYLHVLLVRDLNP